MHLPATDPARRTVLHRASPRLKLLAALVIITGTALLPRRTDALYLVPTVLLLALWPLSGMPVGYAIRRLALVEIEGPGGPGHVVWNTGQHTSVR